MTAHPLIQVKIIKPPGFSRITHGGEAPTPFPYELEYSSKSLQHRYSEVHYLNYLYIFPWKPRTIDSALHFRLTAPVLDLIRRLFSHLRRLQVRWWIYLPSELQDAYWKELEGFRGLFGFRLLGGHSFFGWLAQAAHRLILFWRPAPPLVSLAQPHYI